MKDEESEMVAGRVAADIVTIEPMEVWVIQESPADLEADLAEKAVEVGTYESSWGRG